MIMKIRSIWSDLRSRIKSVLHSKISTAKLARSVTVGTFIALTPTFGFQMPLIGFLWSISKFSKRWRFNLPISLSLTWITNYFTIIPYYFLCYHTGIWLGDHIFRFKTPMSYDRFSDLWQGMLDAGFWASFKELALIMLKIGKPLFLGSIPYAVIGSFVIYKVTYYLVKRYREDISSKLIAHIPHIKIIPGKDHPKKQDLEGKGVVGSPGTGF